MMSPESIRVVLTIGGRRWDVEEALKPRLDPLEELRRHQECQTQTVSGPKSFRHTQRPLLTGRSG
jgi:hypothetical protein